MKKFIILQEATMAYVIAFDLLYPKPDFAVFLMISLPNMLIFATILQMFDVFAPASLSVSGPVSAIM